MLCPQEPFLKNWVSAWWAAPTSRSTTSVLHFLDLHSKLLQTHWNHPSCRLFRSPSWSGSPLTASPGCFLTVPPTDPFPVNSCLITCYSVTCWIVQINIAGRTEINNVGLCVCSHPQKRVGRPSLLVAALLLLSLPIHCSPTSFSTPVLVSEVLPLWDSYGANSVLYSNLLLNCITLWMFKHLPY